MSEADKQKPELQNKLKEAEEEAQKNYDRFLRVMAEFENYKKRIAKEKQDHLQHSQEMILKDLLKVLDDFDRIMDHLSDKESQTVQGLVEGIQLVHKDFFNVLKKFGLKPVTTENKNFDPHLHEAIGQVESNDHPEGKIIECHRKGYQLHDRLLRPATVTIAKSKKETDEKS